MKVLSNHFIYLACSCLIVLAHPSLGEESTCQQEKQEEAEIQENLTPGFSYKTPLVVEKVKDDVELLDFQTKFIKQWCEDYIIRSKWLFTTPKNRLLQVFCVLNEEGQKVVMYFDITDVAKKYHSFKDKDFREKVKTALKKGPFKLLPKDQAKKVSWADTSENVRNKIWTRVREDLKKGTLDTELRQEIKEGIPLSDIPEDIRKEIFEGK